MSEPINDFKSFKKEYLLTEPDEGNLIEELKNNFGLTDEDINIHLKQIKAIYSNSKPGEQLKSDKVWRDLEFLNPLIAVRLWTFQDLNISLIVNKILRERISSDPTTKTEATKDFQKHKHFIFNLQCAIINLPGTSKKETVYKGMDVLPEDFLSLMKVHGTIVWTSFTSCSLEKHIAEEFAKGKVIFEITIPPNQGADIHKYSIYPLEKELLLPAFSKFKITSITEQTNGVEYWIKMDYLQIDETNMPKESKKRGIIYKHDKKYYVTNELSISPSSVMLTKKVLGTGAFGIVLLGKYQSSNVAVKKIELSSPDKEKEFEKEIVVMSKCNSPNVVRLIGTYSEERSHCIVMEYMKNGDLQQYLALKKNNQSEAPLKLRYRMGCDIARGVYYLHERGIVHSDIKSSNILLDKYFRAKISDFGISKIKESSSIFTIGHGKGGGTTSWMAPEVESEEKPTTKESDMFSVGITLWELMSFEKPFSKITPKEYNMKLLANEKREEIPPNTPPILKCYIEKCWEHDPQNRPKAAELIDNLLKEFVDDAIWGK
eukprot:TRINITY_DN7137_c0_g1_i8.p2 TRINITY_DN7137_c0_g1~~TRINITY_DN7137_c0_g1_i8.p2  ORF type:complete len:545 (-),score=174.81 TRINITY_DN7137_c0_g1_i8:34-1668(-)